MGTIKIHPHGSPDTMLYNEAKGISSSSFNASLFPPYVFEFLYSAELSASFVPVLFNKKETMTSGVFLSALPEL